MSVPTVLAVLVVHDGSAWIQRVLQSVARQTHPSLGVVAVDNASTDDSPEILERVLGPRRVVRMKENRGFPAAMRRAMELPAAREADYLLFLHDDAALDPEAVARLVEAAERVEDVGMVGPKVLDWEDPSVLREVGFAADRFGFPHSPLETDEIDQGQYDAPREVLFVSSAAMLVSRDAWTRAGPPDDRLGPCHADLGFGWRVRVAGYRVLVAPRAVAFHRVAAGRGERGSGPSGRERYHVERAALATLLTNQRLLTLLWLLPVFAVQGIGRLVLAMFSRRFDDAGQMLAAWGWNVAHLPGTIHRRARTQAARRVSDHEISRFLSAGTPIQRWVMQGSALLTGRKAAAVEPGEEPEDRPFRQRVASLLVDHPVAVGLALATVLTLVAFRGVLFAPAIEGGAFPVIPSSPGRFFREFGSAWRTYGFGGDGSPSPALLLLGAGSVVTFGAPAILMKCIVALTPLLAGVSCARAVRRFGVPGVSAVAAGAAYALSALTLWTTSEGRVGEAALLVAVPWLWSRCAVAFGRRRPEHVGRWVVGTGIGLAVAVAFFPSMWIVLAAFVLLLTVAPERGGRGPEGVGLMTLVALTSAALLFPFVLTLLQSGGDTVVAPGRPAFLDLIRLAPGAAPGTGPAALFLPLAALVAFSLIEGSRESWRAIVTVGATVPLAWFAAAGYLPEPLAVPSVYLAIAAFAMATLIGMATGGLFVSARRAAFGTRQIAVAVLGAILALGLAAQSLAILPGAWGVGASRILPAWPVVASSEPGVPLRVLWIRAPDGEPFAPPGGDPQGVVSAGPASVAYGVTGRAGRSILALGAPGSAAASSSLERTLRAILTARVRHGGALLAPFAIGYLIVEPGTLPAAASDRLAEQVDLDLVQRAGGLLLYRNARALPRAVALPPSSVAAARDNGLLSPTAIDTGAAAPLRGGGERWAGAVPQGGLAFVADEFDPDWTSDGGPPFPAFGWALGVEAPAGATAIVFDGRLRWNLQLAGLGVLWLAALWIVRRRPSEEQRPRHRATGASRARAPRQPTGVPAS